MHKIQAPKDTADIRLMPSLPPDEDCQDMQFLHYCYTISLYYFSILIDQDVINILDGIVVKLDKHSKLHKLRMLTLQKPLQMRLI